MSSMTSHSCSCLRQHLRVILHFSYSPAPQLLFYFSFMIIKELKLSKCVFTLFNLFTGVHSCFTAQCQFLLHSEVNVIHIHVCNPSLLDFLPIQVTAEPQVEFPVLYSGLPLVYLLFIFYLLSNCSHLCAKYVREDMF